VTVLKRTLSIATALGVGALVLTGAAAVFCQATLHVPRRAPGNLALAQTIYPGAAWRTVSIRAIDGAVLEAWFVEPSAKPSGRCVAVLHGIADSRSGAAGFAPMFLAEGYAVLLPDSRGHGQSGGEFVTYGLLEKRDVLEWAHWMRSEGCAEIYGLGESLGASILIQATAISRRSGPSWPSALSPISGPRENREFRGCCHCPAGSPSRLRASSSQAASPTPSCVMGWISERCRR